MEKHLDFNTMEEVNLWLQKHPEAEGCHKALVKGIFVLYPNVPRIERPLPPERYKMTYKGIVHADILTEKEVLKAKSFRRKPRKS